MRELEMERYYYDIVQDYMDRIREHMTRGSRDRAQSIDENKLREMAEKTIRQVSRSREGIDLDRVLFGSGEDKKDDLLSIMDHKENAADVEARHQAIEQEVREKWKMALDNMDTDRRNLDMFEKRQEDILITCIDEVSRLSTKEKEEYVARDTLSPGLAREVESDSHGRAEYERDNKLDIDDISTREDRPRSMFTTKPYKGEEKEEDYPTHDLYDDTDDE